MNKDYLKFKISEPHTSEEVLGVTMLFEGPIALATLNAMVRSLMPFIEKHKDDGKNLQLNAFAVEVDDTQAFHSFIATFCNQWQTASKGKGIRFNIHAIVDYPALEKTIAT